MSPSFVVLYLFPHKLAFSLELAFIASIIVYKINMEIVCMFDPGRPLVEAQVVPKISSWFYGLHAAKNLVPDSPPRTEQFISQFYIKLVSEAFRHKRTTAEW